MKKWYGVSSGNGNDGVSQSFPDYLVFTSDPWFVARAAMVQLWKDEAWANSVVDIDGDAEYTISATIYEGPHGETEFGAAASIVEVFPISEHDNYNCQKYECIYDAFSIATLELLKEHH